jgi:hypothetical protein
LRCDNIGHDTEPVGRLCLSDREIRFEHFAELAHVISQPDGDIALDYSEWADRTHQAERLPDSEIHRFLIHNILFLRREIPKGLMFPFSAAMLKNPALYDHFLEAFSNPLMPLIEYNLDDLGQMNVPGETGHLYSYIDMTAQAEALYDFVKLTIEHELVEELDFLANYDRTKQGIQEIVDMPDRLINLFIQLCLQNNGHLSAKKRIRILTMTAVLSSMAHPRCGLFSLLLVGYTEDGVAQPFLK